MSELDPNEPTTSTDLDPTTAVPVPTAPLIADRGPARRRRTQRPGSAAVEPAVAWAAGRAGRRARPQRGSRAIAGAGRPRSRSWPSSSGRPRPSARSSPTARRPRRSSATSRPTRWSTASSASTCRATSAQAAGEFLSKFPGFADQAALESKLDEVLDELVERRPTDDQTYTTDIKPWFDGELAFASARCRRPRRCTNRSLPRSACSARSSLMSVKDPALAQAWIDGQLAEDRRDHVERALRRHHPDRLRGRRTGRALAASPSSTARSPSSATWPRSRPPSTPRAAAASPTSPDRRPP